jgi:steroid 5-alpha reductase family enzyme
MFDLSSWMTGLVVLAAIAAAFWLVSLPLKNASIVDSIWSLLFVAAAITYAATTEASGGGRRVLILVLVLVWGLRLAGYITWRNWGEGEDKRYQAMRAKQGPNFPAKSLLTVFGLQAILAWIVSLPLLAAVDADPALGILDWIGVAIWAIGFAFEAGGDSQLARFKANPDNAGKVMNRGFWRYTRHPNYFGDFTQWWAFYLIALAAGGWWALPGPLVMSYLLLRVSGVALLERGLEKTRPKYADYVATTNAFFPWFPRRIETTG